MPRGVLDAHPTLVYTHIIHRNHITKVHTQDTKSNVHHVTNKINTKHTMGNHYSFLNFKTSSPLTIWNCERDH
jgi:hypothetical protein